MKKQFLMTMVAIFLVSVGFSQNLSTEYNCGELEVFNPEMPGLKAILQTDKDTAVYEEITIGANLLNVLVWKDSFEFVLLNSREDVLASYSGCMAGDTIKDAFGYGRIPQGLYDSLSFYILYVQSHFNLAKDWIKSVGTIYENTPGGKFLDTLVIVEFFDGSNAAPWKVKRDYCSSAFLVQKPSMTGSDTWVVVPSWAATANRINNLSYVGQDDKGNIIFITYAFERLNPATGEYAPQWITYKNGRPVEELIPAGFDINNIKTTTNHDGYRDVITRRVH